jgi:hypothetical protein
VGATHTEFNPDCEDAVFVAGFASEDSGVEQVSQTLFGLSAELVKADFGVQTINGEDIEELRAKLPANVALGVESCLKKCNISKKRALIAVAEMVTVSHAHSLAPSECNGTSSRFQLDLDRTDHVHAMAMKTKSATILNIFFDNGMADVMFRFST